MLDFEGFLVGGCCLSVGFGVFFNGDNATPVIL